MKLGFVSAILDGWNFEEMIDTASEMGFSCAEVACWPCGKAERRYAGVSHINVDELTDEKAAEILAYCAKKGVEISSLAFYPNTMDADLEKRAANVEHLKKVIRASHKLGVNLVTTFIGRDQTKTVEENLELVKEVWPPIIAEAEKYGVKIGIENCPMLFGPDQWPGGQNLMTTPANWRKVFEILPSDNLGINYDPSHFVWQMIDYIKPHLRVQRQNLPCAFQGYQALSRQAGSGRRHGLSAGVHGPQAARTGRRGLGPVRFRFDRHRL